MILFVSYMIHRADSVAIFHDFRMSAQAALDAILDSDTDDNGDFSEATVVIHPPNDGAKSDEESGDEEIINPGHLTRGQLTAPAEVQIPSSSHEEISTDFCEEDETQEPLVSTYN